MKYLKETNENLLKKIELSARYSGIIDKIRHDMIDKLMWAYYSKYKNIEKFYLVSKKYYWSEKIDKNGDVHFSLIQY